MRCQVCKRERCLNEMSVNVSIVWNCDRLLNEMPANNYIDSLEACLKLVSLISSWFDAFRSSVEIKTLSWQQCRRPGTNFWTIPSEVYGRLVVSFVYFCVQLFTWQMSGVRVGEIG